MTIAGHTALRGGQEIRNPLSSWVDEFLRGEPQGFALDFTNLDATQQAKVVDGTTPANTFKGALSNFLSQTAAVTRLMRDAAGNLVYSAHNYSKTTQAFTTTSWATTSTATTTDNTAFTTAPDGTSTAAVLAASATATAQRCISQSQVSATASFHYTSSVYLKAGTCRYANLSLGTTNIWGAATFDLQTGTVTQTSNGSSGGKVSGTSITAVGNGWYRVSVTVTNIASWTLYISAAGSGTNTADTIGRAASFAATAGDKLLYMWGAHSNRGSQVQTYLPNATTAAKYGLSFNYDTLYNEYQLLTEQNVSNIILWSQDFTQGRTTTNCTAATAISGQLAPDLTPTVSSLKPAAGTLSGAAVGVAASATVATTSGGTYAYSVFAKKVTGGFSYVYLSLAAGQGAWFDLNTSTVVGTTGTILSANVETFYTNGWVRLCLVYTASGTAQTPRINISDNSSSVNLAAMPAATETTYFWGQQHESSYMATSYIQTAGASASRGVDTLSMATTTFPYSEAGGTWYIECYTRAPDNNSGTGLPTNNTLFIVGTSSQGYGIVKSDTSTRTGRLQAPARVSNTALSQSVETADNVFPPNQMTKIAMAYDTSVNVSLVYAGTSLPIVYSAALPTGMTAVAIGNSLAHLGVRKFGYVPRRMPDQFARWKTAA